MCTCHSLFCQGPRLQVRCNFTTSIEDISEEVQNCHGCSSTGFLYRRGTCRSIHLQMPVPVLKARRFRIQRVRLCWPKTAASGASLKITCDGSKPYSESPASIAGHFRTGKPDRSCSHLPVRLGYSRSRLVCSEMNLTGNASWQTCPAGNLL